MAFITTYNTPKPFSFTYTKLKNYETCPKRYYEIDYAKSVKESESDQLKWGNAAHKALAKRCSENVPLPEGMEDFEKWCARVTSGGNNATILVEQKLAIDKEFNKCDWKASTAWYRGIGDVIKIVGDVALIVDWKTGKVLEDSVQLALMAQCVFAHYPEVQRVRSEFIWLKHDATTREDFSRENMISLWNVLLPRVKQLQHAHETMTFPPKPGGLCRRHCPVQSCPHWGK